MSAATVAPIYGAMNTFCFVASFCLLVKDNTTNANIAVPNASAKNAVCVETGCLQLNDL